MEQNRDSGRKELICIGCPLGCNLEAQMEEGEVRNVTGNTCPRGRDYAIKELTDPRRIVTSLVRVKGGERAVAPVKTVSDIPKRQVMDCIRALREIELTAPVSMGEVAAKDICGSGVDVVVTADVGVSPLLQGGKK